MGDYQVGGGLRLFTALEKTKAFAEFLQDRMILALETQDPAELHYLLAQVDDYHSFMWRYYRQLSKERGERSDPGAYPPPDHSREGESSALLSNVEGKHRQRQASIVDNLDA